MNVEDMGDVPDLCGARPDCLKCTLVGSVLAAVRSTVEGTNSALLFVTVLLRHVAKLGTPDVLVACMSLHLLKRACLMLLMFQHFRTCMVP
jgi:hypothetical protein